MWARAMFGTGGNLAQQWMSIKSSDSNRQYDVSYCHAKYQAGVACPWNTASSANTDKIQYLTDNKTGVVSQMTYDSLGRLTAVTNWGGHSYAYAYDANGNRTSVTRDGATVQTLTYTADNTISTSGFAYDKAGRRTADPVEGTTGWNALGQSVTRTKAGSTQTSSYAGYGQDELIRQSNSSGVKTYVWGRSSQAGIPTMEYSMNTQDNSPSVVDNDANGMPINFLSGATSQYVVFDGLGRMWGTVGNTGDVTSKYVYDPYQQLTGITYPAAASSPASSAAKSTSQMQATTSSGGASAGGTPWATFGVQDDLVKNWWKRGARWHDTRNGVWTSGDPITRLADPTRANPYLYVGGDPINQFDPAGRFDIDWGQLGHDVLTTVFGYTVSMTCNSVYALSVLGTGGASAVALPEAALGCTALGVTAGYAFNQATS